MTSVWALLQDAFWSGLAALGFAVLFQVPRRTLIGCVICGAAGHATRTLIMEYTGANIALATLVGATMVGFLSQAFARHRKAPALIFSVSGAIPMVPGVFAYQTMLGILQLVEVPAAQVPQALADVSLNAILTGLILVGIATGIIAPSLLFRRRPPVV